MWSERFDNAYLGVVEESSEIAGGCGACTPLAPFMATSRPHKLVVDFDHTLYAIGCRCSWQLGDPGSMWWKVQATTNLF